MRVPFLVPNIVLHRYKKAHKRDPNLQNYPYVVTLILRITTSSLILSYMMGFLLWGAWPEAWLLAISAVLHGSQFQSTWLRCNHKVGCLADGSVFVFARHQVPVWIWLLVFSGSVDQTRECLDKYILFAG